MRLTLLFFRCRAAVLMVAGLCFALVGQTSAQRSGTVVVPAAPAPFEVDNHRYQQVLSALTGTLTAGAQGTHSLDAYFLDAGSADAFVSSYLSQKGYPGANQQTAQELASRSQQLRSELYALRGKVVSVLPLAHHQRYGSTPDMRLVSVPVTFTLVGGGAETFKLLLIDTPQGYRLAMREE